MPTKLSLREEGEGQSESHKFFKQDLQLFNACFFVSKRETENLVTIIIYSLDITSFE